MIRAVCFDFDGTLAHFSGDFEALTDTLRHDLGLAQCDANSLSWRRAQIERRGGPMTFGDTVRAALGELELRVPDDLERLAAQVVSDYSAQIRLLPGARELLAFCRDKGKPLALITNGPADMQRAAVRVVGLETFFQRILVSGDVDVGVRKPHPRIFAHACAALGTRPEDTLMVGDNPEADLGGARVAGMQAVGIGTDATDSVPDLYALEAWLGARL